MLEYSVFTSESVSEGHPDKMADQISDAILDAILAQDKYARVACETLVKTGVVVLAGEVTTTANVDYEKIARDTVNSIGYNHSDLGFDGSTCAVLNILGKQSPDIAQGVDRQRPEDQGAGDQGLMFGYASNETPELMPAPICYAHRLVEKQAELRKNGILPWLRPDAKSQVTFQYENGIPKYVDAIVLSTQHDPSISQSALKEAVMEEMVKKIFPADMLREKTQFHINPTGLFIIGGPVGDCGLTGRKIIVDTYQQPMQVVMWPRISLHLDFRISAKSKSVMRLALPNQHRFRSTRLGPGKSVMRPLLLWFANTSIYVLLVSVACSIYCILFIKKLQATATLVVLQMAYILAGNAQIERQA